MTKNGGNLMNKCVRLNSYIKYQKFRYYYIYYFYLSNTDTDRCHFNDTFETKIIYSSSIENKLLYEI